MLDLSRLSRHSSLRELFIPAICVRNRLDDEVVLMNALATFSNLRGLECGRFWTGLELSKRPESGRNSRSDEDSTVIAKERMPYDHEVMSRAQTNQRH